ncbi:hypothetical protein H1D24_00405 [Streptomyces sp. PSKA28]|uniref:Uncharacterized protein n=2 Tax=Streptomyces TaxID=1883 RepID=A0A7W0I6V8_9ACTN|nr:hypothetical protein [Streptomyces himalayensis subsp. himalayensis]
MCALYGRALPRDFLDIAAAITSGRYSRDDLLRLAAEADPGFAAAPFADALSALTQITDVAFAEYGTPPEEIQRMRRLFADWRDDLQRRTS